jgi:DNA-binding GntR family transcriptional regulator
MSQSLAGQVYEIIKREIITCAFKPGQQIAQQQLADRYTVGVTPVREALQKLTREGLIQPIPRFGYLVTPITVADVAEVFELRTILETAAARLAALRASSDQLEHLSELAGSTYVFKVRESYSDFLGHNREFHVAVARASGNRRLADSVAQVMDEMTRMFHLGLDVKDSADEMRNEHQELVDRLRQKDPIGAEQVVLAQISRSQARIFEALRPGADRPATDGLVQSIQFLPRELRFNDPLS